MKIIFLSDIHGVYDNLVVIEKLLENYKIDKDNGKNFNNYLEYLQLYVGLCEYYSKYHNIARELSNYCFLKYSNLSNWYYSNDG